MQLDEDRWIDALVSDSGVVQSARVDEELRAAYGSLSRKAVWMVEHLRRRGVPVAPIFEQDHLRAWHAFVSSAASAVRGSGNNVPLCGVPTVYVSYHHSSYPLLARSVLEAGIYVLVARHVPWLHRIGGRLINFMESSDDVLHACRRGESVFAMMDYCYDRTRSARYVPFLSYQARTPTGILSLARRYGHEIAFLTPEGSVADGLERRQVARLTTYAIATWVNHLIEERVRCEPSSWLLWASLDRRLHNVNYEE